MGGLDKTGKKVRAGKMELLLDIDIVLNMLKRIITSFVVDNMDISPNSLDFTQIKEHFSSIRILINGNAVI